MFKEKKAYTLIELVVVMGLITLIALVVLPLTVRDIKNNDARSVATDLVSMIELYQSNAFTRRNDKNYGIAFYSNKYTLFTGTSLASADYTEDVLLGSATSITNINFNLASNQLIFSSGSVKPNQNGSFRVTNGVSIYIISINKEGYVEFTKG